MEHIRPEKKIKPRDRRVVRKASQPIVLAFQVKSNNKKILS